ncbi:MAG: hypothetical protein IPM39_04285 [Chloroflexi bacterium]|nr:hypothetical protein [Chloroflexota bacterium]
MASSKQIETKLRQALEGKSGELEVQQAIVQAGLSGSRRFAALLKRIAEETAHEDRRKVTYDALRSLEQLGEPPAYFQANARAHEANKWLAYYSILILAHSPNDAPTRAALDAIKTQTADNQIRGAIAEAERLRALAAEYQQLHTAQAQIEYILSHFRGGWNPISFGQTELGSATDPLAVWSQQELRQLSQAHPDLAAECVARIDLSEQYAAASISRSYRDYIAQFLATEAVQRLQELEAQRA